MAEIYSAFTQANLRHRVLAKKNSKLLPVNEEVKDDIVLIQLKLVNSDSDKLHNTISFINMPLSKANDPNIQTLQDILIKFKAAPSNNAIPSKKDFIPYNKSILTRILAPQLSKDNLLVLTHFTKKAL